jgi:hypothetical protein
MKVEIIIEQFDNGITIKERSDEPEAEPHYIVALERDQTRIIGETIWSDIKYIFDTIPTNIVRMTIDYQPIEEKK